METSYHFIHKNTKELLQIRHILTIIKLFKTYFSKPLRLLGNLTLMHKVLFRGAGGGHFTPLGELVPPPRLLKS